MNQVVFSSVRHDWATPQPFFDTLNDEFGFTLDACASPENAKCSEFWTPDDNALIQDWVGVDFWNPCPGCNKIVPCHCDCHHPIRSDAQDAGFNIPQMKIISIGVPVAHAALPHGACTANENETKSVGLPIPNRPSVRNVLVHTATRSLRQPSNSLSLTRKNETVSIRGAVRVFVNDLVIDRQHVVETPLNGSDYLRRSVDTLNQNSAGNQSADSQRLTITDDENDDSLFRGNGQQAIGADVSRHGANGAPTAEHPGNSLKTTTFPSAWTDAQEQSPATWCLPVSVVTAPNNTEAQKNGSLIQRLSSAFKHTSPPCNKCLETDTAVISPSVAFLNPPYGYRIGEWVRKAFTSAQAGATVVALIPAKTETRWWHADVMRAAEIRLIRGRLRFSGCNVNAPFPSAVVVFRQGVHVPVFSAIERNGRK